MNKFYWDKFTEMILSEAKKEEAALLDEIEKEKAQKLDEADTQILDEVYHSIQNKISEIRNLTGKKISDKMLADKKELLEKRNAVKAEIFDALKLKLSDFRKSDAYKDYCVKKLTGLKKHFDGFPVKITVGSGESGFFKEICAENRIDAELEESKEISFGGFLLFVPEKKVLIDETIDKKLTEQYESFEQFSGLYIE